jgi:hypothetical protein
MQQRLCLRASSSGEPACGSASGKAGSPAIEGVTLTMRHTLIH